MRKLQQKIARKCERALKDLERQLNSTTDGVKLVLS
jgi:hypothetical protein